MIDATQFKQIFPKSNAGAVWAPLISTHCPEFSMDAENLCDFLAQCGHESAEFTVFRENLNYSAEGMANVWPRRFARVGGSGKFVRVNGRNQPNEIALSLHRKPEAIANNVYANRMGNGDVASGDGWKFMGRGAIQTTGRSNYSECSDSLFGDSSILQEKPELLLEPRYALLSALWFWEKHNLNAVRDFTRQTRIINGGETGLKHRQELRAIARRVIL